MDRHYFWQDLWAARRIYESRIRFHVDVGSRLDGFIAHLLPFCHVVYMDYRPAEIKTKNLQFVRGSILGLPFQDNSIKSLSCLHVLEHIGLGRYGGPIQPNGHLDAAAELARVLAPGGQLLLGTPVGKEGLHFDAHRVFDPKTVLNAFSQLELNAFSLIDDKGEKVVTDNAMSHAKNCDYGCGLFVFEKPAK